MGFSSHLVFVLWDLSNEPAYLKAAHHFSLQNLMQQQHEIINHEGPFLFAPDMEDVIKERKFEGHPRPIGPVSHAVIHIKGS